MVLRKSKYGTNRKITKYRSYIKHNLNPNFHRLAGDPFPIGPNKLPKVFSSKEGPEYRCYTDTDHYEVIDKNERKKVYNKINKQKDQQQSLLTPMEYKPIFEIETVESQPDNDWEETEYDRRQKLKEESKVKKKVYKLPANLNRSLYYVEGVKEFSSLMLNDPAKDRILRRQIVKNEGKQKTLYSDDQKGSRCYYKKGYLKRTNRKREFNHQVEHQIEVISLIKTQNKLSI